MWGRRLGETVMFLACATVLVVALVVVAKTMVAMVDYARHEIAEERIQ